MQSNVSPQEHNVHPVYRPDIDGLRAVAILSVVVFHAFPSSLQGGFVGVDIFFVISGFLISSIIFRSLQRGDFNFIEFYAHRIKRIFPALIAMLTASFAFGWFALLPEEFKQLGKHMAAGAGFVQNFVLWQEAGYFDTATELKPLMHLWSLAIEEQFYLIYPLLIWGAWRLGLNIFTAVILLGGLSFGMNVAGVERDVVKTFFLPQTRFWELLIGALLAYLQLFKRVQVAGWMKHWVFHPFMFRQPPLSAYRDQVLNNLLSGIGLILIVVAVSCTNKVKLFPGWWALIPVIGTFLLILAGPETWVNRHILATRPMIFVGVISYPLYLWHWSIFSFARIVESEVPSRDIRVGLLGLSVLLAWFTYRFLERPIRFGKKNWIKTAVLSTLLMLIGYVGYNTFDRGGLSFRGWVKSHQTKAKDLSWDVSPFGYIKCNELTASRKTALGYCLFSKNTPPSYAVFGDSHADHLFYGLASKDSESWMLIGNSSCPPVTGIHVLGSVKNCDELASEALDFIVKSGSIKTVVLSFFGNYASSSNYAADHIVNKLGPEFVKITSSEFKAEKKPDLFYLGLDRTISILEKSKKNVVIVVDVPELPFFPQVCIGRPFSTQKNKCVVPRSDVYARQAMLRGIIERLHMAHPNMHVYDPAEFMCDQYYCYAEKDNSLLYRDSHHLSFAGSRKFAEKFLVWFKGQ